MSASWCHRCLLDGAPHATADECVVALQRRRETLLKDLALHRRRYGLDLPAEAPSSRKKTGTK